MTVVSPNPVVVVSVMGVVLSSLVLCARGIHMAVTDWPNTRHVVRIVFILLVTLLSVLLLDVFVICWHSLVGIQQ